jgi:hypothetical protein
MRWRPQPDIAVALAFMLDHGELVNIHADDATTADIGRSR